MEFRQKYVQCLGPGGLHRMAYTEWGDPASERVLLCVHGLARCGRDFDVLAEALARDPVAPYRVICPDVVGRGCSDWLRDPAGYALPQYMADMVTLIARLDVAEVHWLGTSMGGLIGMLLASQAASPISRLVINDVGPLVTAASIQRIAQYVGADPTWESFQAALAYMQLIGAPFGNLSPAQWRLLTEHSVRQRADGRWGFAYDPRIAEPFKATFAKEDVDLWPVYDRIACPTLVVRGAESDLLARPVWQEMGARGPRAHLLEVAGVGHAPMFLRAEEIAAVRDFLAAGGN